jgi:hypothetical protein
MREEQWQEIQPFLKPDYREKWWRIEEILPDHSPCEREFLRSGTTVAERRTGEMKG